jgi:hypothetical protein
MLDPLPLTGSLPPCLNALRKVTALLEKELFLLARLVYHGTNQHRAARWWSWIRTVRRLHPKLARELAPVRAALEGAMCVPLGSVAQI